MMSPFIVSSIFIVLLLSISYLLSAPAGRSGRSRVEGIINVQQSGLGTLNSSQAEVGGAGGEGGGVFTLEQAVRAELM